VDEQVKQLIREASRVLALWEALEGRALSVREREEYLRELTLILD
jgi:hypothetical protein